MVKANSNVVDAVRDIARHEDPLARNAALLALIDTLGADEFESVVGAFRELGITNERRGEYAMLLTAWAKMDPDAALTYASENTGGTFARNTILATWAGENPEAAIAWAENNHEGDDANPWLVGVIRGLAPKDLSRATDLMGTLPRSRERGEALQSMISMMMARDSESAKEWTASIEDEYLRSGAYAYTAEAIAEKNPEEAARWLADLGDTDALNRVGGNITQDWYRENPEDVVAYVSSLPPEAMSEAAEGVVDNMAREDPVGAAEYLSQLAQQNPDVNFDGSIGELVRGSARQDPELAAIWIGGLRDEGNQARYYHRVLGQWQNRDSQAAMDWMRNNEVNLPESIYRRFLERNENSGQ
jgi:hypothetical protein